MTLHPVIDVLLPYGRGQRWEASETTVGCMGLPGPKGVVRAMKGLEKDGKVTDPHGCQNGSVALRRRIPGRAGWADVLAPVPPAA